MAASLTTPPTITLSGGQRHRRMEAYWQDHSALLALHFRRGGQGRCSRPQSARHHQGRKTQGQGRIHSILRCHRNLAVVVDVGLFCQAARGRRCPARVQEKGKLIPQTKTNKQAHIQVLRRMKCLKSCWVLQLSDWYVKMASIAVTIVFSLHVFKKNKNKKNRSRRKVH